MATKGVTHGKPVLPEVFNMVVGAVVWKWIDRLSILEFAHHGIRYKVGDVGVMLYTYGVMIVGVESR